MAPDGTPSKVWWRCPRVRHYALLDASVEPSVDASRAPAISTIAPVPSMHERARCRPRGALQAILAGSDRPCRYRSVVDDLMTWASTNPLGATIVGGLAVLVIWSLIGWLAKSRKTPARWLVKFFKWLWSWRPVSVRRHQRDLGVATEATLAVTSAHAKVVAEKAVHDSKELEKAIKDLAQIKVENAKAAAVSEWNSADWSPKKPPLPKPRWFIEWIADEEDSGNRVFQIKNIVPRSVALEVRVEGRTRTTIQDKGQWPDLTGPSEDTFVAWVFNGGEHKGVEFHLSWHDEHGNPQSDQPWASAWEDEPEEHVWGAPETPF
jgi:hypothetical protein